MNPKEATKFPPTFSTAPTSTGPSEVHDIPLDDDGGNNGEEDQPVVHADSSEETQARRGGPTMTPTIRQQPRFTSGVTFAASQSVEDVTELSTEAEGTVSAEKESKDSHKIRQADPCVSGNYSTGSSAEATVRTRLETMDSTNVDSVTNNIDYGYDIDHRDEAEAPPPQSFLSASSAHSKNAEPSKMRQYARAINLKWTRVTKQARGVLLRGVVRTSVTAARYPMFTIVSILVVSIALIVAGYMTNFNVRLDNEKIFTPISSELVEFAEWVENRSLYEGTDVNQRRRVLEENWQMKVTEHERSLARFNFFDGNAEVDTYNGSATDTHYDPETTKYNASAVAQAIVDVIEEVVPASNETVNQESTMLNASAVAQTEEGIPSSNETVNNENGNMNTEHVNHHEEELPQSDVAEQGSEGTSSDGEEEEEEKHHQRGLGIIFPMLIHANTKNIFTIEGINRAFDAVEYARSLPGFKESCYGDEHSFRNYYGENTCEIRAITRFWNHNRTLFQELVKTEEDLFQAADTIFYPDGGYVDLPFVLAEMQEDEHGRPVEGQAFYMWIYFKEPHLFREITSGLLDLQNDWEGDGDIYIFEFTSPNSFAWEVSRSISGDLPLVPVVFVVMCLFTCLVFFKCHLVHSRSLLGVGAVVTVFMSVLSGYGLMFICGVPMTIMTNLLIFVVFGIGLDDTFIITGAYFRTGYSGDPIQRVERTMEAVGSSILLTTITTTAAFVLGATSSIMPIRWLCMYAAPAVLIDFFYQITFFIAILVLDERRMAQNRMDWCCCFRVEDKEEASVDTEEGTCAESPTAASIEEGKAPKRGGSGALKKEVSFSLRGLQQQQPLPLPADQSGDHVADRFMRWFATRLMNPVVKIVVIVVFSAFAVVCAHSTTKLRQEFSFKDLLPKGSYVSNYLSAVEHYSDRAIAVKIKFRLVDQSDEDIRNQMERYVDDLVADVEALNEPAPLFWVREFRTAVAADPELEGLPFYEQLNKLLSNPTINDAVGSDIEFREDGTILASQVRLFVTDLDMENVRDQIKFLQQQREVTARQPINQGKDLWCFFSYDLLFHIFAFYEVAAWELAVTTISSVAAVCFVAFILIPHWSAVPIIAPLISVLYIEMLGVLQMFGFSINVITYIVLVISIGLLVDFIMHILLRYYESECNSREEKVKDALGTMGASILVGGLSTFLGVTPLIFSQSEIFATVCMAFLAMVFLGVTHGLILLPVLLSYFGTETVVRHRKRLSLAQIRNSLSQRFHIDLSSRRDFSTGGLIDGQ